MRHYDKFKEYIWLVKAISQSHRGLSLKEINQQWVLTDMSGGLPMTRNTFMRHKAAIETMFGLYIDCDPHSGYRYRIGNEHVLQEDSVQNWLLQTISVSSLISESLSLQQRILLEHVVTDSHLLQQLITAMRQGRMVALSYHPYQADSHRHHTVAPYCLKLCRQRWYLLGRFAAGGFAVFALDRIARLELLKDGFSIDPYFDADDYFTECYGVVTGDGTPPQRIVLRAYGREQWAMRDLPLHHTQRLLAHDDDHTDFELTLRPTSDFKAHLLSRGRWLRVLSPLWLADDIRRQHLEAVEATDTPAAPDPPVAAK